MNNNLAISTGAIMAIMIYINGKLTTSIGNYLSSIIIHLIGLIAVIAILVFSKSKVKLKKSIPLYAYSGGAIALFTVFFNNITVSKLGVSLTIAVGLLGQSIASLVIDHYGLFGVKGSKFKKEKLVGLALIIGGITIMTVY